MFSVQHKGFWFQNKELKKKTFFGQKGGCNKTVFLSTCVLENVKSYRFFLPIFLAILGWCSKNTVKIGISAHFQRPKIGKNGHF